MDNLQQQVRFGNFKKGDDLQEYLDKQVKDAERLYTSIAGKINYLLAARRTIEAHTGDDSLLENESGSVHTNLGASGAVTLTLPTSPTKGTQYSFAVQAAQELRIDPGAATIRDDSGQTPDKYKTANAIGECITLIADENGDWETIDKHGTWTEEA